MVRLSSTSVQRTGCEMSLMSFTKQDAKDMRRDGESATDILRAAVQAGVEYPSAVWLVTSALRLDSDEVEEMECNYDEQC